MTERQGIKLKIKKRVLKSIDKVMCKIYHDKYDNPEFTEKIIKNVGEKFSKQLFDHSKSVFLKQISPENNKDAIAKGTLAGAHDQQTVIMAMQPTIPMAEAVPIDDNTDTSNIPVAVAEPVAERVNGGSRKKKSKTRKRHNNKNKTTYVYR